MRSATQFKKGSIPWNKGIKLSEEHCSKLSVSHRGQHSSPLTEFKKGQVPFNRGRVHLVNDRHPQWKGDDVGYGALHAWVKRKKGKFNICEWCEKEGMTDFANLDYEYSRDLETWAELCRSCHLSYDRANGWRKRILRWRKVR